jgi:transmembrane sensor
MNDLTQPDRAKLRRYREASEWLVRLNAPGASEQEVEQWLHWCEADAGNLSAFEKLQGDWQDTAEFKRAPELLSGTQPPRPVAPREPGTPGWKRRTLGWRSVRWVVAASVVLVAVLGLQEWTQRPVHKILSASNQEPATLPDGSSLLLSAKAIAEVDFSAATRHVALRPGGEAYIKVRHDTARPFIVRAGAVTVTAVGTAFDVRREDDRVIVTVEEGTILASAMGSSGLSQWRARAGYQVSYSEDARTAVVSRVDTQSVLRWRDGELAYDEAPLASVIADINRYSTISVVVRDPALLRLRFTGTVFVASVNDWVKALEAKYPVHARVSPDGEIALESPVVASTTGP